MYVTNVSQIEADTGFTFFTNLPSSVAIALKAEVDGASTVGGPAITTQPVAQTTVVGGNATFSVAATGNATLTYQWVKDDDDIPGATNPTLNLVGVQAADAGNYYVVVSNSVASITSYSAPLVISGLPPVFTQEPPPETVSAGSSVDLSVTTSGSPTITYQWRKDGVPISGATLATLSLTNLQASDQGNYDVVVSNSVGSTTSTTGLLTVTPAAPTITTQPSASTVFIGQSTVLNVAALGTTPLTYQWRNNGTPLSDAGEYSGTATSSLTITGATTADIGNYDVVVTNPVGTATSTVAALSVTAAPVSSVVDWDFTLTSGLPIQTSVPPSLTVPAIVQGNIFGGGPLSFINATSASNVYTGATGGNNAGNAATIGSLVTGTGGSAYFQFALQPTSSGQAVTITGIKFGSRSTATGPTAYAILTSLDNFTTPIATGTLLANSVWALDTVALPAPVAGAVGATVTVRIYGYNGTGNAGKNTARLAY